MVDLLLELVLEVVGEALFAITGAYWPQRSTTMTTLTT